MGYREGAGQAFRSIEKFPIKVSHKKVGIYYDDPDKVSFVLRYISLCFFVRSMCM